MPLPCKMFIFGPVYFSCAFRGDWFKVVLSMKVLFTLFSLALSTVFFNASAQVTVDVTLDQDQFLPGEAVPVAVHVTNRSGETIHLGEGDWLTFLIQMDDGSVVVKKSDPPVQYPFDLGSLEVATKRLDLAPYYILGRAGTYKITATVHIKEWNTDITSNSKNFDVIEGAQIWSQTFGVPNSSGPNQPPAVRKYTLVQANYLKSQLRLYLQVTDESGGTIFKSRAIGPMISFSQPEAQMDPSSNLHVLCQTGATAFTYTILNSNGDITKQETYDYIGTHPRLAEDTNGNISVAGGVRRLLPSEMPAVKSPAELAR